MLTAFFQLEEGKDDDDPGDGGHEEAEDDISRRFDPSFARGESSGIDPLDGAIADDEGDVGQGIEDGVGHGGEQRKRRTCRYGGISLDDSKEQIGSERASDGDLVFEMVGALEYLGEPDMLVDGLEPFLDVLILVLVEVLELLGLVGFFVQGDGTIAISFPRGVGAYCLNLTVGLELG